MFNTDNSRQFGYCNHLVLISDCVSLLRRRRAGGLNNPYPQFTLIQFYSKSFTQSYRMHSQHFPLSVPMFQTLGNHFLVRIDLMLGVQLIVLRLLIGHVCCRGSCMLLRGGCIIWLLRAILGCG